MTNINKSTCISRRIPEHKIIMKFRRSSQKDSHIKLDFNNNLIGIGSERRHHYTNGCRRWILVSSNLGLIITMVMIKNKAIWEAKDFYQMITFSNFKTNNRLINFSLQDLVRRLIPTYKLPKWYMKSKILEHIHRIKELNR